MCGGCNLYVSRAGRALLAVHGLSAKKEAKRIIRVIAHWHRHLSFYGCLCGLTNFSASEEVVFARNVSFWSLQP